MREALLRWLAGANPEPACSFPVRTDLENGCSLNWSRLARHGGLLAVLAAVPQIPPVPRALLKNAADPGVYMPMAGLGMGNIGEHTKQTPIGEHHAALRSPNQPRVAAPPPKPQPQSAALVP